MEGLNYHHLLYFRMVAREGSIARAAAILKLSQPTISEQIRLLEKQVATPLFARNGRSLRLTDAGRTALRFAEEIHTLGNDLIGTISGQAEPRQNVIRFGITQGLTSATVSHIVSMLANQTTRCIVRVASSDSIRDDFKSGALDLALALETVKSAGSTVANVGIYGTSQMARKYKARFPASLAAAPLLVTSASNRVFESWLAFKKIQANVLIESADSATVEALAGEGHGLAVLAGAAPKGLMQLASLPRLAIKLHLLASSKHAATAKRIAGAIMRGTR